MLKEAGLTHLLIEKLCDPEINLSPNQATNSKGEILPPLTNLGMGYVFEEFRTFADLKGLVYVMPHDNKAKIHRIPDQHPDQLHLP
jgi:hypothetical protein